MNKLLAVVGCRQLVTLRGPSRPRTGAELRDLGIVEHGALLIRDGVIEAVGPQSVIESAITGDHEVVDAGGRVVLPGFVDAHTHPVFAGTRAGEFEARAAGATYQEIAASGGGIRSTVRLTRAASEEELTHSASRYAAWFLRNGTTTVEAKSGYGLSVDAELKILRVIRGMTKQTPLQYVPTFLGAHEIPDDYRDKRADYVALVIHEMLPRVAAENLAEYCDVFCEKSFFSIDESMKILSAAKELGFGLRVHADQLAAGKGAQLAAVAGAVTADHLEHTTAAGIAALCSAGVQPVLLPASVHALGSQDYPPARAMIDAGLAVVLATDFNPGSSPTPSIPMVLSLAAIKMKMTVAESISAVTINAAYSLGRGNRIGSLEPGKQADFVIHDCDDFRELAYFFGVEPARGVYIGGSAAFVRT